MTCMRETKSAGTTKMSPPAGADKPKTCLRKSSMMPLPRWMVVGVPQTKIALPIYDTFPDAALGLLEKLPDENFGKEWKSN